MFSGGSGARAPGVRHPSVSLSVVGDAKDESTSQQNQAADYPPKIPEEEDDSDSETELVPEVAALMRPKFRPLPPSAQRTRLTSEHSHSSSDATESQHRRSIAHIAPIVSVVDVLASPRASFVSPLPGALVPDEGAGEGKQSCWSYTYGWLSDALGCLRRCYFAEETPPAERYIKPVPLMIQQVKRCDAFDGASLSSLLCSPMQRYYSHVPDPEAVLEFILPPSVAVPDGPVEPTQPRAGGCRAMWYAMFCDCSPSMCACA